MRKIISGILAVFVILPIWYYLLYKILIAINATELMWFLYWVYLPVGLLVSILQKMNEGLDE